MSKLSIPTAEVFLPFVENRDARYWAAHGGRGSGKSQFFAGALIEDSLAIKGLRSVCIREVQKSLKLSSKQLVEDKIKDFKLEKQGFKIFNEVIQTPGDGIIAFQGMQDHTADSIKSLEGFMRAWIEEAQTLSATSLGLLRPTIRSPGSQIWASWNARRKNDAIDTFFRGNEKPTNAIILQANWRDNPWFPDELNQERLDDKRINPDQYDHIWEGAYISIATGAYYAKCLIDARKEGRIGRVGADQLMTYRAFWDIGGTGAKADACAIWIAQFIGKEIRLLDYYEAVGQPLATHINWLRSSGYGNAQCILPHDGAQHDKVYQVTYESSLQAAGFDVYIVQNQGMGAANQRIEALRRLFPQLWIDEAKCQGGLDALGWYHEKKDTNRNIGLGPDHDWSSHCCDAAGMMAVAYNELATKQAGQKITRNNSNWRTV
jgi:phage terminase large subunit